MLYFGGPNCMCVDAANCQADWDDFYNITHAGLDGLMQEYFDHFRALVLSVSGRLAACSSGMPTCAPSPTRN